MIKQFNENEIVDFAKTLENSATVQYYLGSIYATYPPNTHDAIMNELANGKYVSVLSNMCETESERLQEKEKIYQHIFERFGLQGLVSVE